MSPPIFRRPGRFAWSTRTSGRPTPEELAWADAVFVSGMHVQKGEINGDRPRARGRSAKRRVLGGSSVSASPEQYPEFDYLHIGELGDATDALIRALDEDAAPPPAQRRFATEERLPLADFPIPAYELIDGRRYFIGSVQFSSGCPYRCEFCDIPALYGRQPRLKTPEQIIAELDALLAAGIKTSIYFVDDNFIGNKKAARELAAASRRLAKAARLSGAVVLRGDPQHREMPRHPGDDARGLFLHDVLRHRDAGTRRARRDAKVAQPRHAAARGGRDDQRLRHGSRLRHHSRPRHRHRRRPARHLIEFIDRSHIPVLTINLLQALPKTPLWDRLQAAGRLSDDTSANRMSCSRGPTTRSCRAGGAAIRHAYTPEAIYRRFDWNARHTYPNRMTPPLSRARLNPANLRRAFVIIVRLIFAIGLFGDYRRNFWRMAVPALRAGRIEELIHVGLVAHHMIVFARDCAGGRENASFFAQHPKGAVEATAPAAS